MAQVERVAAAGEVGVVARLPPGRAGSRRGCRSPRSDSDGPRWPPSQVWLNTTSRITSIPAACSVFTIALNSAICPPRPRIGGVAGRRGEEPERAVAPVVHQPAAAHLRLVVDLVDRQQLDRRHPERLQVLDDRRRRQPRVRPAQRPAIRAGAAATSPSRAARRSASRSTASPAGGRRPSRTRPSATTPSARRRRCPRGPSPGRRPDRRRGRRTARPRCRSTPPRARTGRASACAGCGAGPRAARTARRRGTRTAGPDAAPARSRGRSDLSVRAARSSRAADGAARRTGTGTRAWLSRRTGRSSTPLRRRSPRAGPGRPGQITEGTVTNATTRAPVRGQQTGLLRGPGELGADRPRSPGDPRRFRCLGFAAPAWTATGSRRSASPPRASSPGAQPPPLVACRPRRRRHRPAVLAALRAVVGIGEIGDLPAFAAFIARAGISLIQVLPLNEISIGNTSPYAALSAFGIDPMFISLGPVVDLQHLSTRDVLGPRASPRSNAAKKRRHHRLRRRPPAQAQGPPRRPAALHRSRARGRHRQVAAGPRLHRVLRRPAPLVARLRPLPRDQGRPSRGCVVAVARSAARARSRRPARCPGAARRGRPLLRVRPVARRTPSGPPRAASSRGRASSSWATCRSWSIATAPTSGCTAASSAWTCIGRCPGRSVRRGRLHRV